MHARVIDEPAGRVEQGHQRRCGGQRGRRVDAPLREVGGEVPHDLGMEMLDEYPLFTVMDMIPTIMQRQW